ncbi:MAG: DNA-binding protein [Desulfobulbaceae bacterium]|nr:MAG: DNA-binding protein [Desulfobulbaceae bacterium]
MAEQSGRNEVEIRRWMVGRMTVKEIRDALGYKSHSIVSNTIAGREHNRRVLGYFLEKGCPRKHLGLPIDMEDAA